LARMATGGERGEQLEFGRKRICVGKGGGLETVETLVAPNPEKILISSQKN